MPGHSLLAQWQYTLPSAILTVAIYLMIARLVISLAFRADSANWIWRLTRAVSDPLVLVASFLTPRIVPQRLVSLLAIAWLVAARILLRFGFMLAATRPRIGAL